MVCKHGGIHGFWVHRGFWLLCSPRNRESRSRVVPVVHLCALVNPGRSVGRSVGRFSHLQRGSCFVCAVYIRNSHDALVLAYQIYQSGREYNSRLIYVHVGCWRFTKLCWVGKHMDIIMKPTNSPTQGQPNPRKKWVKSQKIRLYGNL